MTDRAQDLQRQVKAARSRAGLTQAQLAKIARVSRGTVQNLEAGLMLSPEKESRIEAALGWPEGQISAVRAGRSSRAARPRPDVERPVIDPSSGDPQQLRIALRYFRLLFIDSPEDYALLRDVLDLSDQLVTGPTEGSTRDAANSNQ